MERTSGREESLVEEAYRAAYLGADFVRLASYRQQLQYITKEQHRSALLIGKGDGIVPQVVRDRRIQVTILDVNPNLKPDLLGSVERIPADPASYDICICCQVLEHLPFEKFEGCLTEIRRVTKSKLVLSLPDIRRYFSMRFRLARWKYEVCMDLPRLRPMAFPAENLRDHGHYWEIGYQGYDFRRVMDAISKAGWKVIEYRRVPDLAWHSFFYCGLAV